MIFANRIKRLFIVLIIIINFVVNISIGESQNTNTDIGLPIPSAFKDKSSSYDLSLLVNVIAIKDNTNGIPCLSSRRPIEWLQFIIKDKWIDLRIWSKYMSYVSPIEREKGKTFLVPTPPVPHHGESAIIYSYSISPYDFAMIDAGERLSFLIRISSNAVGKVDMRNMLDQVNSIFNVSPEFINTLQSNLVKDASAYYLIIEDQKHEHDIQINANIYSRIVYGLFSPKYILLSFDGLKRKSMGRSGVRSIWKDSCERVRCQREKNTSQNSTNNLIVSPSSVNSLVK